MGTPEDPVRALAEKWSVDKPAKLAEVQSRINEFTKKMAQTARERGVPVENLTSMRQEMIGLEKEKALLQAKEALHADIQPTTYNVIGSIRKKAGFPEEGFGVSPQAKAWESRSDLFFNKLKASDLTPQLYSEALIENPWLLKVPPETPVYDLLKGSNRDLGFNHLIDELRNAVNPESGLPKNLLIDPKDLNKMTMTDVVDKVSDINAWRATQKAEANQMLANNAATIVHKEYQTVPGTDVPNDLGLRWVQFKPEDSLSLPKGLTGKQEGKDYVIRNSKGQIVLVNDTKEYAIADLFENFPKYRPKNKSLKEALKYEGDTMQHCVGGYCEDIASGNTQIFSLRDSYGMPHATVEVRSLGQDFDDAGDIFEFAMNRNINPNSAATKRRYAEYVAESKLPQERIVQIKGRKNGPPEKEYMPFVQDFVRSSQWSDVGDLDNAGLIQIHSEGGFGRRGSAEHRGVAPGFYTPKELADAMGKSTKEGFAAGGSVSVYDPDEIDEIMNSIDKPTGYAEGGTVRMGKGGDVEDTLDTFVAPRYRKQRATPSSKETKAKVAKASEFVADMVIPQTAFDVALTVLPFGKPGKALAAGILAGSPAEAQAGNMSALLKLVAKEAPEQFQSIRNALLRTYHSGLEHSVVGSTRTGGPSEVIQGTISSATPNKLDLKAARKNIDKSPLIDFHTHPSQTASSSEFKVRPSDTDLKYWMGQYGSSYTPEIPNEVRLMVGTPANKGERTTGAYNFFATDKPAQTLNPKTYEAAKYELQRSKPLQSIKDNSLVGMYLDSGGDLGDLLDSASPLLLQKYFAQKGLGRHEMQLSNRPVTSPSVTEQELFNQIANPAIEIIKSKRFESFAKGGSFTAYDPDQVDAIANQYM